MRELSLSRQCRQVLSHLERTGHISRRSALLDYSIQHLPTRIMELKEFGIGIETVWMKHPTTGQRYADYRLVGHKSLVAA